MKLQLRQPGLRRFWELHRGEDVVATLQIPLIRRGAEIELGGRTLAIESSGLLGTSHVVRDTATREEQARVWREKLHRRLELGDRRAVWKSLGWGSSYGFVADDGESLVRGKVSSGLTRTKGEIEVAEDLAEHEALLAATLTAYLLIRRADDNNSAAAGSVAATSGGG